MSTSASDPATQTPLPSGLWRVDPARSSVEFQVRHLGVATVAGRFREFEGMLDVGADGAEVHGTVATASVDTGDRKRDENLLSAGFFDAVNNPQISFTSNAVRMLGREDVEIDGDFTINGSTRRLTLTGTVRSREQDAKGAERLGIRAGGKISRSDYDMRFRAALAAGNAAVGDRVKIALDLSAVRADGG